MFLNYFFSQVYFPYVLHPSKHGGYHVLNREYAPLGVPFHCAGPVPWTTPAPVTFRISKALAKKLSVYEDHETELDGRIYLYDDRTAPWLSNAHAKAYMARLQLLTRTRAAPNTPRPVQYPAPRFVSIS